LVKDCLISYFENIDKPLVIEGRDMGSVVFPDAEHKVYLDADLETRGKRREGQSNMEETIYDVKKRDFEDKNRLFSPLTIPEGALVIDNSNLSIDETIDLIIKNLKLQ
jgi:cytidylate kinase